MSKQILAKCLCLLNFIILIAALNSNLIHQQDSFINQHQQFQRSLFKQYYLPDGFVYVDQIDPAIINSLRYFTQQNFVGKVLNGYYVNRAIMTKQAALALKKANQQFSKDGYQIVIYDSYRPQKTVNQFIQWAFNQQPDYQKAKYSPYIDKSQLFDKGYLSKKSGHTRGSTLDMSIIKKGINVKEVELKLRELEDGRLIFLLDDNTVDMGCSFDLTDEASHIETQLLGKEFIDRRRYLINVMKSNGFRVLNEQWWHFTLENQPFPNTYFDFDVR